MTEDKINRYSHSKVYKLFDDNNYYYYGSTCLPLHKRFYAHKQATKIAPNRKVYSIFTYERFKNNEIKIVLVENFTFENKEQLIREENKYISKNIDDPKCLNRYESVMNMEKETFTSQN